MFQSNNGQVWRIDDELIFAGTNPFRREIVSRIKERFPVGCQEGTNPVGGRWNMKKPGEEQSKDEDKKTTKGKTTKNKKEKTAPLLPGAA